MSPTTETGEGSSSRDGAKWKVVTTAPDGTKIVTHVDADGNVVGPVTDAGGNEVDATLPSGVSKAIGMIGEIAANPRKALRKWVESFGENVADMLAGKGLVEVVLIQNLTVRGATTRGCYDEGTVYLNLDYVGKPYYFKGTIVHEMIGHPLAARYKQDYLDKAAPYMEDRHSFYRAMLDAFGHDKNDVNAILRDTIERNGVEVLRHGPAGYLETWKQFVTIPDGRVD